MADQLYRKQDSSKINLYPKTYTDNIVDNEGHNLTEILQGFNCYFLSYTGDVETTRLSVPNNLRKQGLWVTYVDYQNNTITEYYNGINIDDNSFKDSSNWRKGNNTLVGNLSISANGNWVIDNKETEFKAQGEAGTTPLIRFSNNKFQVSYNEGKYWENITGDVTNQLKISKYIGKDENLPTSGIAEGTIYMKGPFYEDDDTLLEYPSYRMYIYAWKDNTLAWQDNGEFTSVIAGVVNDLTTGGADKALSAEMGKELGKKVDIVSVIVNGGELEELTNCNLTANKRFSVPSDNRLVIGNQYTRAAAALSGCYCAEETVAKGDKYIIRGKGLSRTTPLYILTDDNSLVLSFIETYDRGGDVVIEASVNGKLYVNLYEYDSSIDGVYKVVYENVEGLVEKIEMTLDEETNRRRAYFDNRFNFVAYSKITGTSVAANSIEHFINCSEMNYVSLKGDVVPTADGKLIMCHDSYFDIDENGRIYKGAQNATRIDITQSNYDDLIVLEYANKHEDAYCRVCDFEKFISICKKSGKIPYITIRGTSIESIVMPAILSILRKYSMIDCCIINSMTQASLTLARAQHKTIALSYTLSSSHRVTLKDVDFVNNLGNCQLCLFDFPSYGGFDNLENAVTILEYAREKGIRVYEAQISSENDVDRLLTYGIVGAHSLFLLE